MMKKIATIVGVSVGVGALAVGAGTFAMGALLFRDGFDFDDLWEYDDEDLL